MGLVKDIINVLRDYLTELNSARFVRYRENAMHYTERQFHHWAYRKVKAKKSVVQYRERCYREEFTVSFSFVWARKTPPIAQVRCDPVCGQPFGCAGEGGGRGRRRHVAGIKQPKV